VINAEQTPYQRLGGEAAVRRLVARFYELMEQLPEAQLIRAMHPQDLSSSGDKLFKFLSGWLGGPPLFEQEYGHPRLRARHLPFTIGDAERDAWMQCMIQAIEEQGIEDPLLKLQLLQALQGLADHMRNQ
jgi:hemoglobin